MQTVGDMAVQENSERSEKAGVKMKKPQIHKSAFLADGAKVIGDVTIGENSSVWYNAVIRGDSNSIVIGEGTDIQDGAILHVDADSPLEIGNGVVIGHGAIVHGCVIGDDTMIGMGAIILSGARIGKGCLIGAGSLVTGKQSVPDGVMAIGSPAKVIRELTEEEKHGIRESAVEYVETAKQHQELAEEQDKV